MKNNNFLIILLSILLLGVCYTIYHVIIQEKSIRQLTEELETSPKRVFVPSGGVLTSSAPFYKYAALARRQVNIEEAIERRFVVGDYGLKNPLIIQDPYDMVPLSALVLFTTHRPAEIELEIYSESSDEPVKHRFLNATKRHEIPVFGLLPGRENHITLVGYYDDGTFDKHQISITTEQLPPGFPRPEIIIRDETAMQPGFTHTGTGPTNYYYVYDSNGEIRWYLHFSAINRFFQLSDWNAIGFIDKEGGGNDGFLTRLPNGNYLLISEPNVFVEINPLGKVIKSFTVPQRIHHDIIILDNGNYLVTLEGGTNGQDILAEVNHDTGAINTMIDFKNILPKEMYSDPNHPGLVMNDWLHMNAVWQDPKTRGILASCREQSIIIKMAYPEVDIEWLWADPVKHPYIDKTKLLRPLDPSVKYPVTQHAVMVLPDLDGNSDTIDFIFFDNNGVSTKYPEFDSSRLFSEARHMRVNEKDFTIEEIWAYGQERGEAWHSPIVSDASFDAGTGNYLITFGNIAGGTAPEGGLRGAVVEVSSNKRVIFEAHFKWSADFFMSERYSMYPSGYNYSLHGDSIGVFGSRYSREAMAVAEGREIITQTSGKTSPIRIISMAEQVNLSTDQQVSFYGGVDATVSYSDVPREGCKYVIAQLHVENFYSNGKPLDLGSLRLVVGNFEFPRINDSFLVNHGYNKLPSYPLTFGSKLGAVAFEVPENLNLVNAQIMADQELSISNTLEPVIPSVDDYSEIGHIQQRVEYDLITKFNQNPAPFEKPIIIQDPYGMSPLTALAMFTTDKETQVRIIVVGKDEFTTISHDFQETNTKHYIPIYGLYPNTENVVVIQTIDSDGITGETRVSIPTDPLPPDFSMVSVRVSNPEKMAEGLTFFDCPHYNANYPLAIDANGDVRWFLNEKRFNCSVMLTFLENGNFLTGSGKIIPDTYNNLRSVYEITPMGKICREYFVYGIHHDIRELANGDFLFAASKEGRPSQNDFIVRVDRLTGKIICEWDLMDILPMTEFDTKPPYAGGLSNWLHNNALYYDESNNRMTISGRHQNLVAQFEADTSELIWALSATVGDHNPGFAPYLLKPVDKEFEYPISQHAAFILPDGRLMLFDNRNIMEAPNEGQSLDQEKLYSRAVIYTIDPEARTICEDWSYGKERRDLYSSFASDVDYLGENHYLVDFGGLYVADDGSHFDHMFTPANIKFASNRSSVVVELLDDEVIFEASIHGNANSNSYKAERAKLYRNTREVGLGNEPFTVLPSEVDRR